MSRRMCAYLDGLVVDHRVDGNGSCLVVGRIGLLPELCSPRCCQYGEGRVSGHGGACNESKLPAILVGLQTSATDKVQVSV
jgi:hypothetical protein